MFRAEACDSLAPGVVAAGAAPLPTVAMNAVSLNAADGGAGDVAPLAGGYASPTTALRGAMRPALKRAMDLAGAALLLLACLPAFLAIALMVRRDGGPVFYAHPRIGRGGRVFGCLKFRSMVVDSDRRLAALLESDTAARAEWEATRKLKRDPRITRIGRLLRATSLDELPQLINVLRGEMSLVGPRPLPPDYVPLYSPRQRLRLAVRPGLAGLAQAAGRNAVPWAERLELDARYAGMRPRLASDTVILLRSLDAVLRRRGVAAAGHTTMPPFRGAAAEQGGAPPAG